MDAGELAFYGLEEIEVPDEGEIGVHASLHEDLGAADVGEFRDFSEEGFGVEGVGVGFMAITAEGTEGRIWRCRYWCS